MPSAGEHPPRDVCYNGFPSPAYSQKRRPRNFIYFAAPHPPPPDASPNPPFRTTRDVILFPTPAFKRMLLVGVGTAIAQQAVGIDAIQYFLVYILDEAGVKTRKAQMGILIALGLIKLGAIILAGHLFDKRGRRPLFFVSLAGMSVSLLLVSMGFVGNANGAGFAVFGLAMYLAFFSLGEREPLTFSI